MRQRRRRGQHDLLSIADAAVVFAPRHFGRVGLKLAPRSVVVPPDFGPT